MIAGVNRRRQPSFRWALLPPRIERPRGLFPGATGRWCHFPPTLQVLRTLMEADERTFFMALTLGIEAMGAAVAGAGITTR